MSRPKGSPERDATFRRAIDEAKAKHNITDVAARRRKVIRAGREKKALCPFHDERSPSMQFNDAKGTFYCFGCGAGGDIVTYVMHEERLGFVDALKWLGAADLPFVDPAERARAKAEEAAARAEAIADAQFMWDRCMPVAGTPAEVYLREARAITMEPPPALRFGVVPTSRDDSGRWKRPYPALVLACTDNLGIVVGLQRVFLRDDGADKRWGKRSKLSLGRPRGAAVRLRTHNPAEIVLCEGPEDGLSLAQETVAGSIWVALGTAMMSEIDYPPEVRSVILARQNDAAAIAAAAKAAESLSERGLAVRAIAPGDGFKDWNDQLRGIRA
jgi:DNA primase